jgi:2-iminobutanoate/2-iminopropanoate deaminase
MSLTRRKFLQASAGTIATLTMADRVYTQGKFDDPAALYAPMVRAEGLVFLAQDARGPDGSQTNERGAVSQARQTVENLRQTLQKTGLDLNQLVSLTIFLTNYNDATEISRLIENYFPDPKKAYPATCFIGVMSLDGGCVIRMDAIATNSADRAQINVPGVPYGPGSRCHGVRVGDLFFLSGVDAGGQGGSAAASTDMGVQTGAILDRLSVILKSEGLSLGDMFRTFMFMPDLSVRAVYGEARQKKYKDIFKLEEYPANSGIGVKSLGQNLLLRSVAIASRDRTKAVIVSDKVRLAPGSFSQSYRAGKWLFIAGQDAITFDRKTRAVGDLAGQTEACLMDTKYIVEAAGGTLDNVVKTTVYLVAGQENSKFAMAYQKFFKTYRRISTMPSGLTVEVKELAPQCLVEIDSVAHLG